MTGDHVDGRENVGNGRMKRRKHGRRRKESMTENLRDGQVE